MKLASEYPCLIELEQSTQLQVDLRSIDSAFKDKGLEQLFHSSYSHIAEIVSNVYQHAAHRPTWFVDWRLSVSQQDDLLYISISDDGQGIMGSISRRHPEVYSDLDAIKLALNINSRIAHRGKGFQELVKAVHTGQLHSLVIASGNCSLRANTKKIDYIDSPYRDGTIVQMCVRWTGGAL